MTYGLQAINPDGFVQIDNNFKTYRVWNYTLISSAAQVTISLDGVPHDIEPLIFARPKIGDYFSSSNISISQRALPTTVIFLGGAPEIGWKFVIAVPISGNHSDTHGIRMYDSFGNTVFDSGWSYVNIDSITMRTVQYNNTDLSNYTQTVYYNTPPFGERYFLLNNLGLIQQTYAYTENNDPYTEWDWEWRLRGQFINENTVTYYMPNGITTREFSKTGVGSDAPIPLVSAYINI